MKERHWREHLEELKKRAAHRARRRANLAKLRERMPPPPPNLFHSAGGSEAAQAWFAKLPPEEQSRIVAPSPSGTSSRGRAKVNKAFQQQLLEARSARRALLTINQQRSAPANESGSGPFRELDRVIEEVRPGVWQCRLDAKPGVPELNPIDLYDREAAFVWLSGSNKCPTAKQYARIRRALRLAPDEAARSRILAVWNRDHDSLFLEAGGPTAAFAWFDTLTDNDKAAIYEGKAASTAAARRRIIAAFTQRLRGADADQVRRAANARLSEIAEFIQTKANNE